MDNQRKRFREENLQEQHEAKRSTSSNSVMLENVRRKREELKNRLKTMSEKELTGKSTIPTTNNSIQDRIADLKRRTTERLKGISTLQPENNDNDKKQKGGLNVGIHPALLDTNLGLSSTKGSRGESKKESASTITTEKSKKVPSNQTTRHGLVLEAPPTRVDDGFFDPRAQVVKRTRRSRQLQFTEHGKHIQEAEALRRRARLEELKKKIELQSKKTGLAKGLTVAEKATQQEEPPLVEWWDLSFLSENTAYETAIEGGYENISHTINDLIQIPIPIKREVAEGTTKKAIYLTKKEQKKIRRQTRAEARKEKQDRQLLGLEPPEPPKVKLSNLMKVLGNEAIKDPTKVEAQVRRQIEERRLKHEQQNEERKLTDEERAEKAARKLEEDAARGLYSLVFRIDYLAHRPHRLKIDLNAKQLGLTGICLLHPDLNLVVVEGGLKAVKKFKKLMLDRINWTDTSRNSILAQNHKLVGADGKELDYNQNKCILLWEGQIGNRLFKFWSFRTSHSDAEAVEILKERGNAEHYWNLAQSWVSEE
ncbi:U4/U6 X U5 tri-snRNP complex subunit Prp3 [Schizosaccharomyces japonicus yFS275]|uniref:U4/U6 X U5 tri-snRNP complex subunit Prp3 n=1 Tax=Schizosaccharomyces japonicus (strain yFS275 / FY16936) TaxID=402676 RepID=B6JYH2_SCHJY|nr:U4/U6 X U5 tri-snRNP complex subunit Prp3 [Schizosaccharomyces japonicus yFS275]EEB06590.1 U4/U6 X U5 tri-snRNP complex subunit Prp3 [Schizosaccharomyces japonicus yFS275]